MLINADLIESATSAFIYVPFTRCIFLRNMAAKRPFYQFSNSGMSDKSSAWSFS